MRRLIANTLILGILSLSRGATAEIRFWGYTGIARGSTNLLNEVQAADIGIDMASVEFPEVWTETQLDSAIASFQAADVQAALFLDEVLFKKFYVPSSPCRDAGGAFAWRLRANWQSRWGNFVAQNARFIDNGTTIFIVVFSEVNNTCLSLADVQTAAAAVKSHFPTIPTVMGYGRSPGAQPEPAFIPSAIDWVGFFKYGVHDPGDPSNPFNADNRYLLEFNSLLAKLNGGQRVILVPDGFWGTFLHSALNSHNGPGTGWPKWYLANVALNYERFALSQPKVVGLITFAWNSCPECGITGTKDLPQTVRDRHREIVCRNLGRC